MTAPLGVSYRAGMVVILSHDSWSGLLVASLFPLTFSDTNKLVLGEKTSKSVPASFSPSPVSQVCGEFRNSLPLELGEAFKCHRHDLCCFGIS